MPSETAEVVEIEAVVEVEAVEATVETVVAEVAAKAKIKINRTKLLEGDPSTRAPSTRISRLASGTDVVCISGGAVPPSSVPNRAPVHGKMSLLRNNEPVTNSVTT